MIGMNLPLWLQLLLFDSCHRFVVNWPSATAFLGIGKFSVDVFSFGIRFLKMIASVMSTIIVSMMLSSKFTSISFLHIRLPLFFTPTSTFEFLCAFESIMLFRFIVHIVSNIFLLFRLFVRSIRIFLFRDFCSLFPLFSWFLLERMVTLKSSLYLYYLISNFFLLNRKVHVKKSLQHLEDRYPWRKNILIQFYLTTH